MIDEQTRRHAEVAERLLRDDTFATVIETLRLKAMLDLADADATDADAIRKGQAEVRATQGIIEELQAMVSRAKSTSGGHVPEQNSEQSE